MSLKNLAIIVDGPTEEGSLRAKFEMIYYESPEFRIGPGNGVMYSEVGYAKGVLPTLVFLLSSNIRAIILIPDLEKRKIIPENFSFTLKKEIEKLLLNETNFNKEYINEVIHICPPNIMFENWIISDVEGIKNDVLIREDATQNNFEGKNGTAELQKIMTTKYKKTVHAKMLFKKTREKTSKNNSQSFDSFINCFNELRHKYCQ